MALKIQFLKALCYSVACPQIVEKALAYAQTQSAMEGLDKNCFKYSPEPISENLQA